MTFQPLPETPSLRTVPRRVPFTRHREISSAVIFGKNSHISPTLSRRCLLRSHDIDATTSRVARWPFKYHRTRSVSNSGPLSRCFAGHRIMQYSNLETSNVSRGIFDGPRIVSSHFYSNRWQNLLAFVRLWPGRSF